MTATKQGSPVVVRNLCCKQHVTMAISAFGAMQRLSADRIEFLVHEDGSFDESDIELVQTSVANARVVRRKDADENVTDQLSRYPLLLQARAQIPYFLKLLDILLIEPTEITCFLDSDVLFLRPFSHFADLTAHGARAIFMTDIQNAYGFRLFDFWPVGNIRFARKLNSGFFAVSSAEVEMDYIHWILRRSGLERARFHTGWFEQGIWAAIGYRLKAHLYDPDQISLVTEPETLARGPVAMHFTGRSRLRFSEFAREAADASTRGGGICEQLRSVPATEYTAAEALYRSLSWRVRRCGR